MKSTPSYIWAKQTIDPKVIMVDCSPHDPYKDFHRDPTGYYVLIRVDFSTGMIELAICSKDHVIEAIFRGRRADDVAHGLFNYEKKHKRSWFKEKTHIAYIGKELKKAELALVLGQNNYFQD